MYIYNHTVTGLVQIWRLFLLHITHYIIKKTTKIILKLIHTWCHTLYSIIKSRKLKCSSKNYQCYSSFHRKYKSPKNDEFHCGKCVCNIMGFPLINEAGNVMEPGAISLRRHQLLCNDSTISLYLFCQFPLRYW